MQSAHKLIAQYSFCFTNMKHYHRAVNRKQYGSLCSAFRGTGLGICYSTTYMSRTRDQQRFTISEVAADWHKPMVLQCIMWPSIAHANGQLDQRCS